MNRDLHRFENYIYQATGGTSTEDEHRTEAPADYKLDHSTETPIVQHNSQACSGGTNYFLQKWILPV